MTLLDITAVCEDLPEIQRLAAQQNASREKIIRLIGAFPPFLFQENPELYRQYEGFVCCLNTLSYGGHTNTASPALFGGYEYTPEKINSRPDVLLKDEQNEALKVMPLLFSKNGYEVTVCDPPYANYQWIPDLSVYEEIPEIRTFITEGRIEESSAGAAKREAARERNLFCYGLFRISPLLIQSELYDEGNYNHTETGSGSGSLLLPSSVDCYTVLHNLPEITYIREEGQNTFLMIANGTTHDPMFFRLPEYTPEGDADQMLFDSDCLSKESADGRHLELTDDLQLKHYQTNMAALMRIGEWLDYLRKQDVYDNTRIILVSDHGHDLGFPDFQAEDADVDMMLYNPLLMIKDFNSRDKFTFSDVFMTNADTPVLALSGLIDHPENPFTSQSLTDLEKQKNEQLVCESDGEITTNHGTTFSNPVYYTLRNHAVLNPSNWSKTE